MERRNTKLDDVLRDLARRMFELPAQQEEWVEVIVEEEDAFHLLKTTVSGVNPLEAKANEIAEAEASRSLGLTTTEDLSEIFQEAKASEMMRIWKEAGK